MKTEQMSTSTDKSQIKWYVFVSSVLSLARQQYTCTLSSYLARKITRILLVGVHLQFFLSENQIRKSYNGQSKHYLLFVIPSTPTHINHEVCIFHWTRHRTDCVFEKWFYAYKTWHTRYTHKEKINIT